MIKKLTEYYEFIENCKNKTYTEVTHTHHILPRFMGGTDDKENLIELSVADHTYAHIILAESVDDEYKNGAWWSVARLKEGWGGDVDKIIENIRQSVTGVNNPFYGRKHSDESKRKIASSHPYLSRGKTLEQLYGKDYAEQISKKISKSKDKYKRSVLQFDLDGNFIKEWSSQKEAVRETKISHIYTACKGIRNTAGGYIWKYKNE